MNANELRVGNYYKADIEFPQGSISAKLGFNEDRIFRLGERENKVIWASYSTSFELWKFINPIPLTEEWLLLFNFSFDCEGVNYIDIDNLRITIHYGGEKKDHAAIMLKDENTFGKTIHFAKCQYVHQLQNLYFALTGEEITTTE